MKTILKNLSLLMAILISLCSCVFEDIWVNPISDVQDAKIDNRLIGTWSLITDPGIAAVHIFEIDQHSVYLLLLDQPPCPAYFVGHMSEVDGRTFLNLRALDCSTKELSKYVIFEYEFNDENELNFYDFSYAFVKQAIQNKRLSGNFEENMVVTATSLEIREFIKNSPKEKLFRRDNPLISKRFERPKAIKKSLCILF